jgi:protein-arginine kinase activator protein McsA
MEVMTVSNSLNNHISDKIMYHQKLLNQALATEEYLQCAKHRDEIARLTAMLEPQEIEG